MANNFGVTASPGVYCGIWTNWSKGRIFGATLTLDQRDGALLIAFLALLVSFVGTRLWRIICYALHYLCSSASSPNNALYHQCQAIVRNSETSTAAIAGWVRLIVAWRHYKRTWRQVAPLVTFSVLMAATFAVAGVFSSCISSSTGREVLVQSNYCGVDTQYEIGPGFPTEKKPDYPLKIFTTFTPYLTQRISYFSSYASRCYTNNPDPQGCHTYVKSRLPSTINRTAACPFRNNICRLESGNILLDTGYLNSHYDLGMNTAAQDRFLYRQLLHCAPLISTGHTKRVNHSFAERERSYVEYFYGVWPPPVPYEDPLATYMYPEVSLEETHFDAKATRAGGYTISLAQAFVINSSVAYYFTPIDALLRDDADVTLVFLSANDMVYLEAVDDPWYSAHRLDPDYPIWIAGHRNASRNAHYADQTVSTLGCAKQHQFCLPDDNGDPLHCSRLGGQAELYYLLSSLPSGDGHHKLTVWAVMSAIAGWYADSIIAVLGPGSLAPTSFWGAFRGPVPDDQWQKDVEHWHFSTLAAMQASAVDTATGPSNPDMRLFTYPPHNEQQRYLCNNQKILSSAHLSFSIFGLAFTVGIGGFIIVMSIALDPAAALLQRRSRMGRYSYARLEWCTNGVLQLQRLAHEEQGAGTWSRCTNYVPICGAEEHLAQLDVNMPQHPVLRREVGDDDISSSIIFGEEKAEVVALEPAKDAPCFIRDSPPGGDAEKTREYVDLSNIIRPTR